MALKGGSQLTTTGPSEVPLTEAIDDCGLRFLLAARHHIYLLNTLPLRQRAQLQQRGLSPAYYVWAFHSESEEVCMFMLVMNLEIIDLFCLALSQLFILIQCIYSSQDSDDSSTFNVSQ